jgi:deoxyribodipyrimidine photolyase-like uncharacterized protein
MTVLRVILGDQLSARLDIVAGAEKGVDVFLLAEVMAEATYVHHHVKKIAFLFSAMRHFAEALQSAGHGVRYVALDDNGNSQTLDGEILSAVEALRPDRVAVTEPGEWRLSRLCVWRLPCRSTSCWIRGFCAHMPSSPPGPRGGANCGWNISIARCGGVTTC